jgi:Kdo2-lipid IVA lauroyltransferase/acyltransferase
MAEPALIPAHFPRQLDTHWPAPWRPNPGSRGGALALLEFLAVRGALSGASRLPNAPRAWLLDALAWVGQRVDRRHGRAAAEWLEQAFGAELGAAGRERRVRGAFRHLLRVTLETERVARCVRPERLLEHVDLVESPDIARLRSEGRGALFISAHLGDWETAACVLPWIGFDPLYVVSRPIRNRYLALHAQRLREQRGMRLLPRHGAMRDIPAVLSAGAHVAMLLDQRGRHRPVIAPFFGRAAACERAPGVIVRRSRSPIVLVTCTYAEQDLRWRFVLGPVLWPETTRRLAPEELAARINAELERQIRAHPDQQLWLHDRYRQRGEGAAEPAADDSDEPTTD